MQTSAKILVFLFFDRFEQASGPV